MTERYQVSQHQQQNLRLALTSVHNEWVLFSASSMFGGTQ